MEKQNTTFKQEQPQDIVQQSEQPAHSEDNYFLEFSNAMQNTNPFILNPMMNPLIANQWLKNVNMNPLGINRNELLKILNNPKEYEQALRRISQHLYMVQLVYKRMVHYLSDILTFDYYMVPVNAESEDMSKPTFKSDYKKASGWFDRFKVKSEFRKAILKMTLEDGYFTYLREDSDGDMFFQELPIDWCMIDNTWKYGYLFSFDMTYFQQVGGGSLDGYPKEFINMYNTTVKAQNNQDEFCPELRPELRNGKWAYWYELKPEKAWVFKFHDIFAGLIPPFLGVFLDLVHIPELKDLLNAKSELEAYKIIMGTVPMIKDGKTGSQKDNFAISADSLGKFTQLVKNSFRNKYVDFKAVPLEDLELFTFDDKVNKNDPVSKALNNISSQAGIDKAMFNTEHPSVATINLSKLVDAEFLTRLYSQFANFCTYHINKTTRKYKFKVVMEGTIFDKEDRIKKYMDYADKGIVLLPQLASAIGMNTKDMLNSMALTKSMGFMDKLEIMPTAYTRSSEESSSGRPQKADDELGESGEHTRNAGNNEERE